MKKRKSCTLSQNRSLKNSQSLTRVQSLNSSSKFSNRSSNSSQSKRQVPVKNTSVGQTKPKQVEKKETYKSLESLFDLSKPVELETPNFPFFYPPVEEEKAEVLYKKSHSLDQFGEPNDYTAPVKPLLSNLPENDVKEQLSTETDTESEKSSFAPALSEIEEKSSTITMADEPTLSENENEPQESEEPPVEEVAETAFSETRTVELTPEDREVEDAAEEEEGIAEGGSSRLSSASPKSKSSPKSSLKIPQNLPDRPLSGRSSIYAPDHTLPLGVGQGVPLRCGQNRDSVMSTVPLATDAVAEEMRCAEEKAFSTRQEIQELKKTLNELTNKEDLSEEDTLILRDTQTAVMAKLAELGEITRKIQRMVGLCDPSTQTFGRMFEMLPYPHVGTCGPKAKPMVCDPFKTPTNANANATAEAKDCGKVQECTERFAFPQVDYPEDKLPRVIVCGTTEDNFPKIVVADSRPKGCGKKCLQAPTGKLSESLCMQETLTKENANLEGGNYQLEKAIPEKDNVVEGLQRKICGLQAEIRLVVKDNCDLSKKVACLAENQRRSCSPPYSGDHSPANNSTGCGSPCRWSPADNGYNSPPSPRCNPPFDSCKPPQPPPRICDLFPRKTDNCGPQQQKTCGSPKPYNPCGDLQQPNSRCTPEPRKPFSPYSVNQQPQQRPCCPSESRKPPCYNPCGTQQQQPRSCEGSPEPRKPVSPCGTQQRRLCGGGSCCGGDDQELFQDNMYGNASYIKPSPPVSRKSQRIAGGGCCQDVDNRLNSYGDNTKQIGEQLANIENEVRCMQYEWGNVRRERHQLEQQRKQYEGYNSWDQPKYKNQEMSPCGACNESSDESSSSTAQQLCALREQYARLQDDYKGKLCEVSRLRSDLDGFKREAREAKEERERLDIRLDDALERLKIVESERDCLLGTKEQLVEQEQALLDAQHRFRDTQEELEELRSMIRDQASQLDAYRNKYLLAQQQVEEQKRQMDLMEMDNARMNESVTLEIGRVKHQFQEKLAELAPLPDILKQTQVKYQECTQQRMMAEQNCEELSRELLGAKEKIDSLSGQISELQRELSNLQEDFKERGSKTDELEQKNGELRCDNERLQTTLTRLQEEQCQTQKRLDEKIHEIVQLNAMLEQIREDSARQVARTKDRCETIKRSMQAQISDFEMQLAQCRAAANSAQKERDEIRQKMQGQICNLNDSLQQAQGRIKSLQGHVDYLKVSYNNVYSSPLQESTANVDQPIIGQGYDSCDCNY